jgi:hypothetical protein
LGTVYSGEWGGILGGGLNQSDPPRELKKEKEKKNHGHQQISGADQGKNKQMKTPNIGEKEER